MDRVKLAFGYLEAPPLGRVSMADPEFPEEVNGVGMQALGLPGRGQNPYRLPTGVSIGAAVVGRTPSGWGRSGQVNHNLVYASV